MKKVYLFLTAICLTALTGCIKEDVELTEANVSMSITTRLDLSSLSSKEQGDAIADINVWAFACDEDGNVKNAEDPAIAWRRITTANTHTSVDVHLQFTTCKNEVDRYYKLVAVINQEAFGDIDDIESFGRETTYKQLANATFVAPEGLMTMNPGHGPGSTPGQMPISHWTIIKLDKDNDSDNDKNIDTHPGECYNVSMPVYRALAKTQLLVAKSDANSTVTIKNVTIGAGSIGADGKIISTNAYPTEGAVLSAASGTINTDGTAGDFATPYDTTPHWYVSSVAKSSAAVEKDILTAASVTVEKTLTAEQHAAAKADDDYTKFTPITSYFLYENKGGSDVWNKASTDGGYYMAVTYDTTPDVENDDKTEYVWLPAVVRNHDYQVRALVNAGGKMTLTLNVIEWEPTTEQHVDFEDEVSLAGNGITWNSGDATISGTNITFGPNANQTLSCTFTINTPVGGKWYAELTDGDVDAFAFESTGTTLAIGEITPNTPVTLTIKTLKNNYLLGQKQVKFRMFAETADGRNLTVHLADGVDEYTIIQNQN